MALCEINTPVKKYLKNIDICVNCGSTKREKRRVVTSENLRSIQKCFNIEVETDAQKLFACDECYKLINKCDSTQKKLETYCNELKERGKDGPLQNEKYLTKKRARKENSSPPTKASKDLFPKTPKKDTPNKTAKVVVRVVFFLYL